MRFLSRWSRDADTDGGDTTFGRVGVTGNGSLTDSHCTVGGSGNDCTDDLRNIIIEGKGSDVGGGGEQMAAAEEENFVNSLWIKSSMYMYCSISIY